MTDGGAASTGEAPDRPGRASTVSSRRPSRRACQVWQGRECEPGRPLGESAHSLACTASSPFRSGWRRPGGRRQDLCRLRRVPGSAHRRRGSRRPRAEPCPAPRGDSVVLLRREPGIPPAGAVRGSPPPALRAGARGRPVADSRRCDRDLGGGALSRGGEGASHRVGGGSRSGSIRASAAGRDGRPFPLAAPTPGRNGSA